MIRYSSLVLIVGVLLGPARTIVAAEAEVRPATHTSAAQLSTLPATDEVTFAQQPARLGDRVAQTMGAELQLKTTITQSGQTANQSQNSLQRRQQRFVEVVEVVDGKARRAHVTFPLSRLTSSEADTPGEEVVQPVEKKSYFVTRDAEQLLVTDAEGAIPPQDEFAIVLASLQNFGLPNPLTKYLLGRTVRVGEVLELPQEVAQQVMGFGGEFSSVDQFELVLKSVQTIDQQPCGVFAATIDATGEADNPVKIRAFGQVVIQGPTCRIIRAELSGPLNLSVAENTPQGSFEYKALGSMRVAIKSQYGHARE